MEFIGRVFTSCLFGRCRVRSGDCKSNFDDEVECYNIYEVRGEVQVFQNWFTGIPNYLEV